MNDRRDFLTLSSVMAASPVLALAMANRSLAAPAALPPINGEVLDFWTQHVRAPYTDYVNGVQPKGAPPPQAQDSTFLFPSTTRGLVPAGVLSPDDVQNLPPDGDVQIEVHVERIRPSPADAATLADVQTGTLRIDVKQVKPLVGLPEALAWTAMATLASRNKNNNIPTLDNVKFDPGTAWGQFQTIPLTGGLGFWSWNFFMKKREGFWEQFLETSFSALHQVQPLLPLLGIPGIAVSGLTYVDQLFGLIQAQGDSQWLFRGLDVAVCATKQSFDDAGAQGANKLLLTNGTYVVFPENKVNKLDPKLTIQDGYLVPPNTSPLQIFEAAKTVVPDASYMTISVRVKPSTAAPKTSGADAKTTQN